MLQMNRQRRGWLVTSAAWGFAAVGLPLGAQDVPAAAAKVVLTLAGNVQKRAGVESLDFDMAMLAKLPQTSFNTKTPWYAQPRR